MFDPSKSVRQDRLVAILRQTLDALSKVPKIDYCPECGLPITHASAKFWLDGCEELWSVSLPYCAKCNPRTAQQPPFAA